MPFQRPLLVLSLEPCAAVPETVGGAAIAGAEPFAATTALGPDVALLLPSEFVAATATHSVWPMSAEVIV